MPARVVLARALMNLNHWPEAIAALNQTVALDPKHPQPHLLLSQIFFRMGDEGEGQGGERHFAAAAAREPDDSGGGAGRPFPDGPAGSSLLKFKAGLTTSPAYRGIGAFSSCF